MFPSYPIENVITFVTIWVFTVCQECAKSFTHIIWMSQVSPLWDISYQWVWITPLIFCPFCNGFWPLQLKAHTFAIFRSSPGWVSHIRTSLFGLPNQGTLPSYSMLCYCPPWTFFCHAQQLSPGGGQESSQWQSWATAEGGEVGWG